MTGSESNGPESGRGRKAARSLGIVGRKVLRRVSSLLAVLAGASLAFVAAWWLFSPWLVEHARVAVEQRLERALHAEVRLRALDVGLVPPQVVVAGLTVGPQGQWARAARVKLRFKPHSSLLQLRPVADVELEGVWLDIDALRRQARPAHGKSSGAGGGEGVPPLRVRRFRLKDVSVRVAVGGEPASFRLAGAEGHVEVAHLTRRLTFATRASGLTIARGSGRLVLSHVHLAGGHGRGGFFLREAVLEGDAVRFRARRLQGVSLRHAVHASFDLKVLRFLSDSMKRVAGRISVDGTLDGALDRPTLTATVEGSALAFEGKRLAELRADIEAGGERLLVRAVRARAMNGEIQASGRLGFGHALPFDVDLRWTDIDTAKVAGLFGGVPIARSIADGHGGFTGTMRSFSVAGQAYGRLTPQGMGGAEAANFSAAGTFNGKAGNGYVELSQGAHNRIQGAIGLDESGALNGAVQIGIASTGAFRSLWQPVDIPKLKGSFYLSGRVGGSSRHPELTTSVQASSLDLLGVRVDGIDGSLRIDPDRVQSDGLVIQAGGGTVKLVGTVGLRGEADNTCHIGVTDLSVDWLTAALARVTGRDVPVAGGSLSGDLRIQRSWSTPVVGGHVQLTKIRVGDEPLAKITADVSADWPDWTAGVHVEHGSDEQLDGAFTGKGNAEFAGSVRSNEWRLEGFRMPALEGWSGSVTLDADVAGPLRNPGGTVNVAGTGIEWKRRRLGAVSLNVTGEQGKWSVAAQVGAAVAVHASVERKPEWPFTAELRWTNADFGPLLRPGESLEIVSSGGLQVNGAIGALRKVRGRARLDSLLMKQEPYEIAALTPITVAGQGGRFVVEPLRLGNRRGDELEIGGRFDTGGELHLDAHGRTDLRILELIGKPFVSARGAAELNAAVDHTASGGWCFAGPATVSDAAFDLGLPFAFTEVNGKLALEGRTLRFEDVHGRAAGGSFRVGGGLDFRDGPDLTWLVTEVSPGFVDWLEVEASGKGTVRGSWHEFTVGGDVQALRVLYGQRVGIMDFVPWFRRKMSHPPRAPGSGGGVRLNLHIRAPDEVYVDNNVAKVEMRADLDLTGNADSPRLAGSIEVLTGQVTFRGRTFELDRGVIEFQPTMGMNPSLNFLATTNVKTSEASYGVNAQISGNADDYRVVLGSDDPELSQVDLMSLITFGKTSAQLHQGGSAVSVEDLIALAPGAVQEQVEEGVRGVLPVDRIEIESSFSRETGALEPSVTIGKDFTEQFSALLSTTFGVTSRRRVNLEYRMTPRVSLLGIWESDTEGQAGAFGGQIKFRHEFRHLPRYFLSGSLLGWKSVDAR